MNIKADTVNPSLIGIITSPENSLIILRNRKLYGNL